MARDNPPSPSEGPDALTFDVDDIQAKLVGMIEDGETFDTSERMEDRQMALAYIDGEMPDLVPKEGKSSAVDEILADAMAWLMPNMARIFQSSDSIGIYEPVAPRLTKNMPREVWLEECKRVEEFASQATDYVNAQFLKLCNGEKVLRDGMYNGFLHGNGILKHYWDSTPRYETETYTGLSDQALADLLYPEGAEDTDLEVLAHTARPDLTALALSASAPALATAAPPPAPPGGPGGPPAAGGGPGGLPGLPGGSMPPGMVPNPSQQQQANGLATGPSMPFPGGAPPGMGALDTTLEEPEGLPAPADPLGGLGGPLSGVPMLHDIKVKRTTSSGRMVVKAVPDEDFLIESAATALNEEECRFCAHKDRPTRSDLIKGGIDPDQVWDLGGDSYENVSDEVRRGVNYADRVDYEDKAGERVEVYECYAQLDLDGDGITEWYQIKMGGHEGAREILKYKDPERGMEGYWVEPWGGMLPFTDLVPDPVPHRWRGRSLYKRLRQPQRVSTALTRRINDNIYQTVEPMRAADIEKVRNKDALYNPKLGAIIQTEGDPSTIIKDLGVPFFAKEAMPLVEDQRRVAERRVGVGDQSAGIDPDAIQAQVATAITAMQSGSSLRKEDYARCLQIGMTRLFKALLHLAVENQDRPQPLLVRKQWIQVDPRSWSADMDVTINTGLGAGNRDRDLQMLQAIAQAQKELILQLAPVLGMDNAIMSLSNLFTTYRMSCEAAGIKNPERFFPDLSAEMLQQASAAVEKKQAEAAQNNPQAAALKAKADADAAKAQQDAQLRQAEMEHKQALSAADLQAKQALAAADMQHKQALAQAQAQAEVDKSRMQSEAEIALAREKATMEIQQRQQQAQADMALEQAKAAAKAEMERQLAEHKAALMEKELLIEAKLKAMQIAQSGKSPGETQVRNPDA